MVQKPLTLFHASTAKDIQGVLSPRRSQTIGGEVGEFVFAGEDPKAAMAYALKTPEMLCIHFMHVAGLDPLHACILRNREKALQEGVEGVIYEVPSDSFRMVLYQGRETYEWVSEAPVPVDRAKAERVTLDDAMKAGIQVFFAPKDADLTLVESVYDPEKKLFGDSKLRQVFNRGVLVWENQIRGLDPFSNPSLFRSGCSAKGAEAALNCLNTL